MTTGRINQDLQTHRSRGAGFASLFFCALFGPKESGDEAVTSGDMLGGLEFAAFPARKRKTEQSGRLEPAFHRKPANLEAWASHLQSDTKTDSSDSTVLSAFCTKKRSRMER